MRFFKGPAFKILCIILSALLVGSFFAAATRSGYSPFTTVASVIFSPAARAASAVSRAIGNLPISFKSSSVLSEENKALKEKIASLEEQMVDYETIKYENEFYEDFLDLKEENPTYTFMKAAVIGKDSIAHTGEYTINKGSLSGVSVNDPVIIGNNLVGLVTEVSLTQSTVKTLLNPEINVSAYDVRTRELGYVTTTPVLAKKNQCCMPSLKTNTSVAVGGIVCTGGVGGIYPRDLIIGTVTQVTDETQSISATAIIEPAVDFTQITDVMVITDFS